MVKLDTLPIGSRQTRDLQMVALGQHRPNPVSRRGKQTRDGDLAQIGDIIREYQIDSSLLRHKTSVLYNDQRWGIFLIVSLQRVDFAKAPFNTLRRHDYDTTYYCEIAI